MDLRTSRIEDARLNIADFFITFVLLNTNYLLS
jgi:hypothetical protein